MFDFGKFRRDLWKMIVTGKIIILLFPVLAWFVDAAYNFLLSGKIEHLLQSLIKIALVQFLVLAASIHFKKKESGLLRNLSIVTALFLAGFLLSSLAFESIKKKTTLNHVKQIISKVELAEGFISKDQVIDLAKELIDEDYQPESITNQLSGFYRRERRELFCNIVNSGAKDIKIQPEDLLVPRERAEFINNTYNILGIIAILSFLSYLLVFFTYIFYSQQEEKVDSKGS